MKGSGRWSMMESLPHGRTLLASGARATGFVMFWDWEIVRWIDVEAKNVGFLQSLSPCSV